MGYVGRYSKEGRNGYDPAVGQNNKGQCCIIKNVASIFVVFPLKFNFKCLQLIVVQNNSKSLSLLNLSFCVHVLKSKFCLFVGEKKQQAWIGKLRTLLETTDNIGKYVLFSGQLLILGQGGHENFRFRNFAKISRNFNFVFREIFAKHEIKIWTKFP